MGLIIKKDKCVGCGICISACPFGALELIDDKVEVTGSCTLCGICVKECGFDALEIPARETSVSDIYADFKGVWVFIQHDGESIHHVGLELISEGGKLSGELGCELCCMLLGDNLEKKVELLGHYEIDRIYAVENPVLASYRTQPYVEAASALIREFKPEIVLIGATSTGRDFAGGLATALKTGLTADCTDLAIEKETRSLLQTRPAFGGNIMATIKSSNHRPQMATVRPKVFPMPAKGDKRDVELVLGKVELSEDNQKSKILEWLPSADGKSIADANIIVSGGRGIGKPENFALLKELADLLGGAVGASRAAVDAGWIDYSHQVGQTGRTVRPKLYIACGISGAVQHLAGMKTSDVIVAINKDPDAPIFSVANYGYVGDVVETVTKMIKELKNRSGV